MTIDLDAYAARVGLTSLPRATEDGLATLHHAHVHAIPFENLDVLLGRPIRLDDDGLEAKLVRQRRGGYCFELNGLALSVMRALGFAARPLLGRVWYQRPGDAGVPPRTHQLSLVEIDGRAWLSDVGFGRASMRRPIPFELDRDHELGSEVFRVRADPDHGFVIAWRGSPRASGLEDLYSFTLDRVHPLDLVQCSHYTSTHPASPFTKMVRAARLTPHGRVTVLGDRLTRSHGVETTTETIASRAELARVIEHDLGIEIDVVPEPVRAQ